MSEPTIAALETVAAPLIKDAEQALAPEAVKVLGDLKTFVGGEADKLRTELPTLVGTAMEHIHSIGTSMLERYQAVMDHIDAHLARPVAAPTTTVTASTAGVPSGTYVAQQNPDGSISVTPATPATPAAPAAPAADVPQQVTVDPTQAPSTTPEASSAPSSTPSTSDTTTATEAPAATA